MLQLIRNNSPFTVIILLIYAIVINGYALFHPQLPVAQEESFLYYILVGFLNVILFDSPFGFTLLGILMIFLQGIYLNSIVMKNKAFVHATYLPAFVYISIVSLYPDFIYFNQPLLANWFLILCLDIILKLGHATNAKKYVFNAGCSIAVAALIHFPSTLYLVLLLISISLMRNMNITDLLIAILGFGVTLYVAAGLLFLFDVLSWLPDWVVVGVNLPSSLENPLYTIVLILGLLILFVMGVYMLQSGINRVNVFIRRGWTSIGVYFIVSIIVAILTDITIKSAWLVVMPPLALFIANAYNAEKKKAFSNFAFYFTLLLLIFCKVMHS